MNDIWNYKGVRSKGFFGTQADWNMTLVRLIESKIHDFGNIRVKASENLRGLFESLVFLTKGSCDYDIDTQSISKLILEFDESTSNLITLPDGRSIEVQGLA
jgi:hypothetical protein